MKAIVWKGSNNFSVEDWPAPKAERGRLVVEVKATSICGTDLRLETFGLTPPIVPGHEAAGVVVDIGPGVSGFSSGDRVAINPVQVCEKCWSCKSGMKHLCLNVRHLGWMQTDGTWAEYVSIDAANAHHIPPNVNLSAAALLEPLAVCYQSFQRAGLKTADKVLIIGDGPFGFLHAQIASAFGARDIIVSGYYDERLSRISSCTGAVVCNARKEDLGEVLAQRLGEQPGVDIVIEATGNSTAPLTGIESLRPQGTLVLFSDIWKPEPLQVRIIQANELNVIGSCRSLNAFAPCLELLASGKVKTDLLIDLTAPFEDCNRAITQVENMKAKIFKAVFVRQ